jgi:hypothetical protein
MGRFRFTGWMFECDGCGEDDEGTLQEGDALPFDWVLARTRRGARRWFCPRCQHYDTGTGALVGPNGERIERTES